MKTTDRRMICGGWTGAPIGTVVCIHPWGLSGNLAPSVACLVRRYRSRAANRHIRWPGLRRPTGEGALSMLDTPDTRSDCQTQNPYISSDSHKEGYVRRYPLRGRFLLCLNYHISNFDVNKIITKRLNIKIFFP